jgi:hypothetical protein
MYLSALKNPKFILFLVTVVFFALIAIDLVKPKKTYEDVLPASAREQSTPQASPTPTPTPSASPSPSTSPKLAKSTYSVAIIGDSMVDTMGERLEYLERSLSIKYPNTRFNLYNYGIGGENVQQGLERFEKPFNFKERSYTSISQLKPDILIVASFAYNPFSNHNRNRHQEALSGLVAKAKTTGSQVYILAEIAPKNPGFGVGPGGINWPVEMAYEHNLHIIEQLENAKAVASSLQVPLIDANKKSQKNGKFGDPIFVSSHDG